MHEAAFHRPDRSTEDEEDEDEDGGTLLLPSNSKFFSLSVG